MCRIWLVLTLMVLMCGSSRAEWTTAYAGDPATSQAACRFEASNGSNAMMYGYLVSDGHVGSLKLHVFGDTFRPAPPGQAARWMQSVPANVVFTFDEGISVSTSGNQYGGSIEVPSR